MKKWGIKDQRGLKACIFLILGKLEFLYQKPEGKINPNLLKNLCQRAGTHTKSSKKFNLNKFQNCLQIVTIWRKYFWVWRRKAFPSTWLQRMWNISKTIYLKKVEFLAILILNIWFWSFQTQQFIQSYSMSPQTIMFQWERWFFPKPWEGEEEDLSIRCNSCPFNLSN